MKQIHRGLAGAAQGHPAGHVQECIAARFRSCCAERTIELWHIQPKKPDQNAFIERYRAYRKDVLNAYGVESLAGLRPAILLDLNVKPEVL